MKKYTEYKNNEDVTDPYLKDLNKDVAWKIFTSKLAEKSKRDLAEVINALDNPFILNVVKRKIENTSLGEDTMKMGTNLGKYDFTPEQCKIISEKIQSYLIEKAKLNAIQMSLVMLISNE